MGDTVITRLQAPHGAGAIKPATEASAPHLVNAEKGGCSSNNQGTSAHLPSW